MTRILGPALAVAAGAIAVAVGPSFTGAFLWLVPFYVACVGYGALVQRITGQHQSPPLTLVTGMCSIFVPSAVLARVGVLGRLSELVVIVGGIVLWGLLRRRGKDRAPARGWMIVASIASVLAIAIELSRLLPPVVGGGNHALLIKQMWDTGRLGQLHQGLGFGVIAEAYATWGSSAHLAGIFEGGLCVAIAIFLLVYELAPRGGILLAITALPFAIDPLLTDQWSGVVLSLAMFFSLRQAFAEGRRSWPTAIIALGAACLRNEYIILAVPFMTAALLVPRLSRPLDRRFVAKLIVGWIAVLFVLQVTLAVPGTRAAINIVILLAVLPVTALVLHLQELQWRSAVAVAWFAALSSLVAVLVAAVRKSQHIPGATTAVVIGLGVALISVAEQLESRSLRATLAAAFGVAIVCAQTSLAPWFSDDRLDLLERDYVAIVALREQMSLGDMMWGSEDVRAMQERAPAGAKIGFWGQSAALLDFQRNPIRDVSWPSAGVTRRERNFLSALTPQSLRGIDYLVFEEIEPAEVKDLWAAGYRSAISAVSANLDELARSGSARLYRVVR